MHLSVGCELNQVMLNVSGVLLRCPWCVVETIIDIFSWGPMCSNSKQIQGPLRAATACSDCMLGKRRIVCVLGSVRL
jgi:hypothetical protein